MLFPVNIINLKWGEPVVAGPIPPHWPSLFYLDLPMLPAPVLSRIPVQTALKIWF